MSAQTSQLEAQASAAPRGAAPLSGAWLVVAQVLAIAAIFLISSRQFLGQGVTLGHVASLFLLPLWVPAFRRYVGGVTLGVLAVLGTLASVWLTRYSSVDHVVTYSDSIANTLLLVGTVAAVGVIFWAREYLPLWAIALTYGIGMLASAFTREDSWVTNPWKSALAVPLAVITLAIAERTGQRWLQILVLLALAAASALLDSRSYFAEFLLAALLVAWQMIPKSKTRRASALRVLAVFGAFGLVIYNLGIALLVEGVLGERAQERSVEQIERAGNILLGARPEAGATVALFLDRPLGFGAGVLANGEDIDTAKAGMRVLNYDPDNGYVENFLFGAKFELHSMAGDLWAYFGPVGVVVAIVALVMLLQIITRGVAFRMVGGLGMFLAVQSLWNLFFNPLYTSAPVLAIALGVGLALTADRRNPLGGDPASADAPAAPAGVPVAPAIR
ncbi:hypothetical protein [Naasia sp. SYSU D00057]|uniref:hypothetical protein n=1 Tax=Naasia sp. SYSU D00057 TaxID=2817380 RepID=UPI001B301F12|nr:hypothetical protein [Naasia sp. SYSU D00057]